MTEIHLQIPSDADYISIVRINLTAVASELGFSYEDIEDMKVAVSEACNNAVLYGEKFEDAGQIHISFAWSEQFLTVRIINRGASFDHERARKLASAMQASTAGELKVGGLGIYLMEALMDEVHVDSSEQETVVELLKYRNQQL